MDNTVRIQVHVLFDKYDSQYPTIKNIGSIIISLRSNVRIFLGSLKWMVRFLSQDNCKERCTIEGLQVRWKRSIFSLRWTHMNHNIL